jgi:hypothetical protein
MEQIEPRFPVRLYILRTGWMPWSRQRIECDVIDTLEDLEQDLEWIDTRAHLNFVLVDAGGTAFDVKLNWLMGEPTEFFHKHKVPSWFNNYSAESEDGDKR